MTRKPLAVFSASQLARLLKRRGHELNWLQLRALLDNSVAAGVIEQVGQVYVWREWV